MLPRLDVALRGCVRGVWVCVGVAIGLALVACNREIGDSCRVFGCSAPLVCETTGDFSRYCTVHCEYKACPSSTICVTAPGGAICMPPDKARGWGRVTSPISSAR